MDCIISIIVDIIILIDVDIYRYIKEDNNDDRDYRVTKSGVGPFPPGSQPRPICYAALLFLSNASSTSLSTLSSPPGSSGRGSRS